MDINTNNYKVELNNQIIQCRKIVRKVKIYVVRKKLREIKKLQPCKKKCLEDKKLKKVKRILEEVNLLKKIKEDDVTRYALLNESIEESDLQGFATQLNRIIAMLAIQKPVADQIDVIRKGIPNYETELPNLLNSLGSRSAKKKKKKSSEAVPAIQKQKKISKTNIDKNDYPSLSIKVAPADLNDDVASFNEEDSVEEEASPSDDNNKCSSHENKIEFAQSKSLINMTGKRNSNKSKDNDHVLNYKKEKKLDKRNEKKELKVEDPFFIAKKVAIPKLILAEITDGSRKEVIFSKEIPPGTEKMRQGTHQRRHMQSRSWQSSEMPPTRGKVGHGTHQEQNTPCSSWHGNEKFGKGRREDKTYNTSKRFEDNNWRSKPLCTTENDEKLHPSWAAKRQAPSVQPFKGKKIKFDLD